MKKFSVVWIAALFITISAQGQLSGPLSGILPGDSTYYVVGNISVQAGDSLIIEAGATLIFNSGIQFDINGYLHAAGTESDSIKFIKSSVYNWWGGIDFNDSASDSSRLEYCVITGSASSGIYCYFSSPAITGCTIRGNTAEIGYGSGIYCENSSPSITNCAISGNTAYGRGGGIRCYVSSPAITNCAISGNTAGHSGGGIYCENSSPSITNCAISGNTAESSGGGIWCDYSSPSITNCAISGNTAGHSGGGIDCSYSSPSITNCAISGNTAEYAGGGIWCDYSSPSITGCTISGNTAAIYGGGIYCGSYSSPAITNCAISGNTAEYDGGGIYCNWHSSPAITNCAISGNTALTYYWSSGGGIYCYNSSPAITNCAISGNTANEYGGGIYCEFNSSPEILNTIVSGNLGNYGVYLYNSTNTTITFSDFYDNQIGNFNYPPVGVGTITTVNANGDSCDQFYNILLDPLFYSTTGDSAYYLTYGSPCIDAGDPDSPLDPDSTIADIGAYYYDQSGGTPPITISLTPYNPPIQIPANGGNFDFNIAAENPGIFPAIVDIWTMATLPNGNEYGPIIGPVNLMLNPGYSGNRDRTQNVPASAPAGLYTYDAYIGNYPGSILDEDHFDFEKLATEDGSGYVLDWTCWGEGFAGEKVESYMPSETALHSPYPNPFNPTTIISFELRAASFVKLIVYDVQGREVQALVTGHLSLGYHEVVFDGTDLSSGMYFIRLTVDPPYGGQAKQSMVRKMVLMK